MDSSLQIIFYGKPTNFDILHYRSNQMRNSITAIFRSLDSSQSKSIAQIQKELLANNQHANTSKRLLPRTQNVNDIKVTSPFYMRPEHCDRKHCFCPYHRKLRVKQLPITKYSNRNTLAQTTNNSPNKKVKAETKKEIKLLSHRSPVQPKKAMSTKKTVRWEGRPKVQSHNFEFDQFLRQFQQILLKKSNISPKDLHTIKSSVGSIFKYIYSHLEEENQVVEQYISKIQKDRDLTQFYMQRFIELKSRCSKKKDTKQLRSLKPKSSLCPTPDQSQDGRSRNQSRTRTKLYQRRQFAKRTMRGRYQKLMVQSILENMDCGEVIEQNEIQNFADLQSENFEQNCQFLTSKINQMDKQTLEELLNQVVMKTKATVELRENNQKKSGKIAILDKIIGLIQDQIKELQEPQNEQPRSYRSGASSRSINRGNSNHEMRKNKRLTILGKINESAFAKSGFSQLRKQGRDSEVYYGSQADTVQNQLPRCSIDINRQNQKALTILLEGQGDNIQVRTGKSARLKLAKYRKLSHDAFYHKKILNQEEEELISKMKITTLSDIDFHLDNLAFQFAEKKNRIKDVEGKIKEYNLTKLMIHQNDSLITAKRKIRVLKSLLKSDELEEGMKQQMKEYLKLMEEQNYVKNRKWANKKIKNVLQMRPEEQEVQIYDGDYDEDDKYFFQQVIDNIFPKGSKLLYYDLFKTQFHEKEVNFEQHVLQFMKNTLIQQKKMKEVRSTRKRTIAEKKDTVVRQQDQKQNALMQVGLNNKCLSNYFLLNSLNQQQPRYQTKHLLSEEECYRPSEDRYLGLLNKLASLSK